MSRAQHRHHNDQGRPSASEREPAWQPFQAYQEVQQARAGATGQLWQNNLYTVIVAPVQGVEGAPKLVHLSIHRRDRAAVHDWRHLQRIKNELVGPECEGVEVYPPERYLVDTSNQYHLWVFADPAFTLCLGWQERLVAEGPYQNGAVQRPFPADAKPADLATGADLERRAAEEGIE